MKAEMMVGARKGHLVTPLAFLNYHGDDDDDKD